jgi:hypothetical protein
MATSAFNRILTKIGHGHQRRFRRRHRQYPVDPHEPVERADRLRDPRQGRVSESRRVGQGPGGAVDGPRAREVRRAQARRRGGGRHRRQHRDRSGARLQRQGLPVDHLHARYAIPGEGPAPENPGRRGPGSARGSLPRREQLPETGRTLRRDPGERGLGQPVRQRRQPPGPLRVYGPGDMGPDRGPGGRLHLRHRHRRHARRGQPLPEGAVFGLFSPIPWAAPCTTG